MAFLLGVSEYWESVYEMGGYSYKFETPVADKVYDFYVFRTQLPNTVPIYKVEEDGYSDARRSSHKIYFTKENIATRRVVSSWYWNWLGTRKTGDKHWVDYKNSGIVGYVYNF